MKFKGFTVGSLLALVGLIHNDILLLELFVQINDFSLEANFVEQEKFELQRGLKPRSLGVQPSAFTFRPPELLLLTAL